ncbi:MAG: hypothetical protein JWO27_2542 [Frankiales bacterium]|nr:hypothetical protein [Frankiales bacterium]MCW2708167.1 hypothetical protein [Frankiales bacterium]
MSAEEAVTTGQAWKDFCRALEAAGEVVLQGPDTPLDRAEGYRYLSRLLRNSLYATLENSDPDRPRWQGLDLVKIGADNPDNIYHSAPVKGTNSYRIRGARGSIAYVSFGSKANRYAKDGTMASTGELRNDDIAVETDGSVEIIVSAERPAEARNWLPLAVDSTMIVLRESYLDRTTEVAGSWDIERLEPTPERSPLTAEHLVRSLQRTAMGVHGTAATFVKWTELFMTRPNELPDWGQEMFQKAGGDPEIFYLHGYFDLQPDEAWVIRTRVPDAPYWNFQLDNWWMESMDWDRKITVNKHTAKLEDDGSLVLVVAAKDPGWGNWIDTTGHRTGTALLRWVGTDDHALPTTEVVKL